MTGATRARFDAAQAVAREAGALLMQHYERLEGFDRKGVIDFVTAADHASEALIVSRLRAAFPGDAILAEEGSGCAGDSGYEWIVDPLDGTTNFVHGFPFFMVSIGLRLDGQRVSGVCYGPTLDELFAATRHEGATLNGRPIRVSATASLADSLVATGFPYNRRDIADPLVQYVKRAICSAHGVRRAGSAAYDQCLLAAGRLDGFFEQGLNPWDLAAGTVIIEEAGGRITGYDGTAFDLFGPNLVCTNGHIHDELRRTVILDGQGD